MRFSTSASVALLSSLISLSSADQITVATVYRYVNATATVYQNYCPCTASNSALTAATNAASGSAGAAAVQGGSSNSNSGSNAVAGSGSSSSSSGTSGSSGGSSGSSSGSSGSSSSNSGVVAGLAGAVPVVTTYQTVTVQFVTSTQYSTYTTTIVPSAGQTSTVLVTDTVTVTIPVTSTITITSTITPTSTPSSGAGTGAVQNSAPYSNSTMSSTSVGPVLTLSTSAPVSADSIISLTTVASSVSASASGNSAGAGADAEQRTASAVDSGSITATSAASAAATATSAAMVTTTNSAATASAVDSASADTAAATSAASTLSIASTTSALVVSATTAAPVSSSVSALAFSASSSVSSASTTTVYNLYGTPLPSQGRNNIWIDDSGYPAVYNNGGSSEDPDATLDPTFVFNLTPTGTTIMDDFGNYLGYNASELNSGTEVVLVDATNLGAGMTDQFAIAANTVGNPVISIAGGIFYMDVSTYRLFVTNGTDPGVSWTYIDSKPANNATTTDAPPLA